MIVSNSPEGVPLDNINLYKCDIPLTANVARRFRVFVWHHDVPGSGLTFTLGAKLSAGTGTISNFVAQYETADPNDLATMVVAGNCCAKAMLYNQYMHTGLTAPALGTSEQAVWSRSIVASQLLAAILEFTLTPTASGTLSVRTYVGSPSASDDPYGPTPNVTTTVPADGHIRGWWPYSDATFPFSGLLNVSPALMTPDVLKCPICESRDYHDPSGHTPIKPPELATDAFGHQGTDTWGSKE